MSETETKLELINALKSFESTLVQCVATLKKKQERAKDTKTSKSIQSLTNNSEDCLISTSRDDKVRSDAMEVLCSLGMCVCMYLYMY